LSIVFSQTSIVSQHPDEGNQIYGDHHHNRRATFIGNHTATVFPFNFKVFTTAELLVIRVDTGGNLTTLALGSCRKIIPRLRSETWGTQTSEVGFRSGPPATQILELVSDLGHPAIG
jgi:hypothetical protein